MRHGIKQLTRSDTQITVTAPTVHATFSNLLYNPIYVPNWALDNDLMESLAHQGFWLQTFRYTGRNGTYWYAVSRDGYVLHAITNIATSLEDIYQMDVFVNGPNHLSIRDNDLTNLPRDVGLRVRVPKRFYAVVFQYLTQPYEFNEISTYELDESAAVPEGGLYVVDNFSECLEGQLLVTAPTAPDSCYLVELLTANEVVDYIC